MILPGFTQHTARVRDHYCCVPQNVVYLLSLQNGRYHYHIVFLCQLKTNESSFRHGSSYKDTRLELPIFISTHTVCVHTGMYCGQQRTATCWNAHLRWDLVFFLTCFSPQAEHEFPLQTFIIQYYYLILLFNITSLRN